MPYVTSHSSDIQFKGHIPNNSWCLTPCQEQDGVRIRDSRAGERTVFGSETNPFQIYAAEQSKNKRIPHIQPTL